MGVFDTLVNILFKYLMLWKAFQKSILFFMNIFYYLILEEIENMAFRSTIVSNSRIYNIFVPNTVFILAQMKL